MPPRVGPTTVVLTVPRPIPSAQCPSDDPPSWDEGRLEMVWETIRCAPANSKLHRNFSYARTLLRCLTAKVLYACRLVGLVFVGFAVWSFANFGQMVKQRVGERDWFVRWHGFSAPPSELLFPGGLRGSAVSRGDTHAFLTKYCEGCHGWYLDKFTTQETRFSNQSEWIGTHCVQEENIGERGYDQSTEDWVNWFSWSTLGPPVCIPGLCSMVIVWAYCVKQLHDHADDPTAERYQDSGCTQAKCRA